LGNPQPDNPPPMRTLATTAVLVLCLFSGLQAQSIADLIRYDVLLRHINVSDPKYLYLSTKGREALLANMLTAVKEGRTKAYSAEDPSKQLTAAQVNDIFHGADTMYVESPDPPYDMHMTVVKGELNPELIQWVRFYESWTTDAKTGRLVKKIFGLSPVRQVPNPATGKFDGTEALYIIKYEDFKY
jgi:hypothetical protein